MSKEFRSLSTIERAAGFALAPSADELISPAPLVGAEHHPEQAFRDGHQSAAQPKPAQSKAVALPVTPAKGSSTGDGWLHAALAAVLPRRVAH
jgi:hypothetical protein